MNDNDTSPWMEFIAFGAENIEPAEIITHIGYEFIAESDHASVQILVVS